MEGKKQALRLAVDRRKENQSLKLRNRRWQVFAFLVFFLLFIGLGFPGILAARVTPWSPETGSQIGVQEKNVVITSSQVDVFRENYDRGLENGFCLYGQIDRTRVVVEEVVLERDPEEQGPGTVDINCVQETWDRFPELLLRDDFEFIGKAHTHPFEPYLSRVDARNLGAEAWYAPIRGIYDGNELHFFGYDDPLKALKKETLSR